jgi:hypothetical protein
MICEATAFKAVTSESLLFQAIGQGQRNARGARHFLQYLKNFRLQPMKKLLGHR